MGCEQEELGLEGTEEEAAQIAKMQAAHRGKQDRKKVAELKGKKIEVRCAPQLTPACRKTHAPLSLHKPFSSSSIHSSKKELT